MLIYTLIRCGDDSIERVVPKHTAWTYGGENPTAELVEEQLA
jgi:hypothetical protein